MCKPLKPFPCLLYFVLIISRNYYSCWFLPPLDVIYGWCLPTTAQSALQTSLRWLPFRNGSLKIRSTPLGVCIWLFLKNFFSNFRFHAKDSKWDRKCILINCTSCNGTPQQIPLWQRPFAIESISCQIFCVKTYDWDTFWYNYSNFLEISSVSDGSWYSY